MPMQIRYDFLISDLLLRVESHRQLHIPDNFQPFYTEATGNRAPDLRVQIIFDTFSSESCKESGDLSADTFPSGSVQETFPLASGESIIRQSSSGIGSPVRVYIPPSYADVFCRQGGNWLAYFALEQMLLPYDRFFLHSSAVIYQGKAYLFSAPSGGGKSTHANLWKAHFGAALLNGDKVLIHAEGGHCTAYGSPVAGSSGIYTNAKAPIAAIFILKKGTRNHLTPLTKRGALLTLYSEAIKNCNDPAFNHHLLDLIEKVQTCVPVFSLECLPEKSAVEYVLHNQEERSP